MRSTFINGVRLGDSAARGHLCSCKERSPVLASLAKCIMAELLLLPFICALPGVNRYLFLSIQEKLTEQS